VERPRSNSCSPLAEVHAAGRPVDGSPRANPPADRLGHRRAVRLGAPIEHHECRSIRVVSVEQAEQPVKLTALPGAHLADAGPLPVQRFPLATTRQRRRRASRTALTTAMASAAGLAGSGSSHSSAGFLPSAARKKPSRRGCQANEASSRRSLRATYAWPVTRIQAGLDIPRAHAKVRSRVLGTAVGCRPPTPLRFAMSAGRRELADRPSRKDLHGIAG
jgi:hypothetical protein